MEDILFIVIHFLSVRIRFVTLNIIISYQKIQRNLKNAMAKTFLWALHKPDRSFVTRCNFRAEILSRGHSRRCRWEFPE